MIKIKPLKSVDFRGQFNRSTLIEHRFCLQDFTSVFCSFEIDKLFQLLIEVVMINVTNLHENQRGTPIFTTYKFYRNILELLI